MAINFWLSFRNSCAKAGNTEAHPASSQHPVR
jgi:hypothetical protein